MIYFPSLRKLTCCNTLSCPHKCTYTHVFAHTTDCNSISHDDPWESILLIGTSAFLDEFSGLSFGSYHLSEAYFSFFSVSLGSLSLIYDNSQWCYVVGPKIFSLRGFYFHLHLNRKWKRNMRKNLIVSQLCSSTAWPVYWSLRYNNELFFSGSEMMRHTSTFQVCSWPFTKKRYIVMNFYYFISDKGIQNL